MTTSVGDPGEAARPPSTVAPAWPPKRRVLGVGVSPTTYGEAVDAIMAAARAGAGGTVTAASVHTVVSASRDPELGRKLDALDLVTPDGQPVRWALNLLHRTRLRDRVYGPELMLRTCARAAAEGTGVYLYGSTHRVLERLRATLQRRFPALRLVGWESPPFRPLTAEEDRAVVERIDRSGARIVFVGLGCPRQDEFAFAHRGRIAAVQICVGAAFDFHAGTKPMAPAWMQRRGLEWLFRLATEPRRLWKRYCVTNTAFLLGLSHELAVGLRDRLGDAWARAAPGRRRGRHAATSG